MFAATEPSGILGFNATFIFQLVIFLSTAAVLWKFAWGPITAGLEARQRKIEQGLRAAAEAEQRLVAVQAEVQTLLEEARGQARDIVTRAHREATADAEEVRAASRREAEAQADRARADIVVERDRAMTELRSQVGALVVAAAGRVLGGSIDERAHGRLIDESLQRVTAADAGAANGHGNGANGHGSAN